MDFDDRGLAFSQLESEFLAAITNGLTSTKEFADRFNELQFIPSGVDVQSPSLAIAHTTVSNIAAIANSLLDVESAADSISADLRIDVTDMFQTLTLGHDLEESGHSERHTIATEKYADSPLHAWLLDRIYNPYPSRAMKEKLASGSGASVKSISDWFVHARRRIGWTAISKRYFGGDRFLTTDCAHRVLVERTGHLYYSSSIVRELEDMKESAEHHYDRQVEQSRIVGGLESVSFSATQDTTGRDRKRHRQASPSSDCESAASSSVSYTGESSRKRSRNATEERDGTSSSSERDSLSSRPSSSLSHTASFTSCSSASAASSPGPLTPLSSPAETHSKLPTDIFNNWIDDVPSEPVLLPPDAADQPCSVLSQKRALSDSDSHHTAKRARLEQPPAPSATAPVSHPATLTEDNGPLSVADELALSMPPLLDILPIAGEGDASVFGNLPPFEDANPDLFSHFITQLEREVPSASTWDDSLLGGSAVEAVPFNFGGSAEQAGNANTQPTSSVVDFFSLFGLEDAAGQDNSEAANTPLLEGQAKGVSEAVLLSSTDLAFLDGLGSSEDGDPDTWSTCADAPGDTDSPATLIDTLSSPQEPEVEGEERTKKLRRLQELLEEAEKLKQEVYG